MTTRAEVAAEARSWIGTPYHVRGRVKGAGCDCGSLLMSVAVNTGLATDEEMNEVYSIDCWQHWRDERYLKHVLRHAQMVLRAVGYRSTNILPGCFLLTKAAGSHFYNHGAIVTEWPLIVHAVNPKVREVDATKDGLWSYREIAVFDFNALIGEGDVR